MARTEPAAQHGWFPDPEEPGRLRMWDGKAWTRLTKYPSAEDVVSGPAPSGPLPSEPTPSGPRPSPSRPSPRPSALAPHVAAAAAAPPPEPVPLEPADATPATLLTANLNSVITLGLALVCIVMASTIGYPLIALVPLLVLVRAFTARETMAPLAALAATASAIIGLVLLAK